MEYLKLIRKFQNRWVALNKSRTKVIADAKSIEELTSKTSNVKERDMIFTFIQDEKITYAP